MSIDSTDNILIYNKKILVDYLISGCKPSSNWKIGTEHEKFPFFFDNQKPVPYFGKRSILSLLRKIQSTFHWKKITNNNNIIGLSHPDGKGSIALEPGGQFELSGAPLDTVHETYFEFKMHIKQINQISKNFNIGFFGLGSAPTWKLHEVPRMPKFRYQIMKNCMKKSGIHGLNMMYRTSTIQVNLDFSSEEDMRRKMQIAMKLQPLTTAIFCASPFTEGKPNGFFSWRSEIWRYTDKTRTGILPFIFSPNFSFSDYVEWALDIPVYFIFRNQKYYNTHHVTFRQFMNGELKNCFPDWHPRISDWINHLSTVFPEVRLKKFIEMRGSDSGPSNHVCAISAYWTGLLYDENAISEVEDFVHDWEINEVKDMRDLVPRFALQTPFRNTTLLELSKKIFEISKKGLNNRNKLNEKGQNESIFLDPIEEILDSGKTESQKMLNKYYGEWNYSLKPLFKKYSYT